MKHAPGPGRRPKPKLPRLTFDVAAQELGVTEQEFREWASSYRMLSPQRWADYQAKRRDLPLKIIRYFLRHRLGLIDLERLRSSDLPSPEAVERKLTDFQRRRGKKAPVARHKTA